MDINLNLFDYEKIGYHGHRKIVIDKIIRDNKFNLSDGDWEYLGTGIYFFEDDVFQAIRWCKYARKYDSWSVVQADIKSNKLLDLVDTLNFDYFQEFTAMIKDRYKKIDGFKKITTKLIFDLLNEVEEFDVVRHVFPVGRKSELVLPTKIARMQVQLCVRNQDCITDIEEVDLNGR